ncbi:MAG: hypothetical protein E6J34_06530 [Chloroflexi bacterium]|nr:MAG: hypothetical protein E6J34_06530 [Chloroflexota bacterium]
MHRILYKYSHIRLYEIAASLIILIAVLLRLICIALGWPLLDSDEGTMGLMGMHIAFRNEHPIFFYAQGYMGATEAYLAALAFRLFGVSSFTLRLGLVLMFAGFMIGMYLLTSLLYTKKFALITLIFLAIGSNPIFTRELVAVGGDPETLLAGTMLLLLASWLALSSHPDTTLRHQPRRLLVYGAWGLVAGFGIWSHTLIAPFMLLGGLLLVLFCWHELLSLAPLLLVLGMIIGAAPLIYYNVTAPPGQNTLFYIMHVLKANDAPVLPWRVLFPMELKGAFLITLPAATGASPLCYGAIKDVHLLRLGSVHDVRCTLVHTGWSLAVILLWSIAVAMAVRSFWRHWRRRSDSSSNMEERALLIRHSARLALLFNAAITFLLYVLSPNSAFYPVAAARYLIGLLVTTPAILWPLWMGDDSLKSFTAKLSEQSMITWHRVKMQFVTRHGILVFMGSVLLLGVFCTFTGLGAAPAPVPHEDVYFTQVSTQHLDVPAVQRLNRQEDALIHDLLRIRAVHIYSDYWTCNRIIFQSREHIICSVVHDHLGPGHNRYAAYPAIVMADRQAAYVLHVDSLADQTFLHYIRSTDTRFERYKHYQRLVFDGYAVYQLVIAGKV